MSSESVDERGRGMRGALALLLAPLFVAGGCADEHRVIDDPCGEPSYGGEATDEAWMAVVDAYELAQVDHRDAVTLAVPQPGEVFTGDEPATLSWTSPLATMMWPWPPGAERGYLLPLRWEGGRAPSLSPPARAHLPPISGDVHYLEVFVPGRECAIRTLTTLETWRPRLEEWQAMRGKGALTLVVTSVYLEKNRITEGPYRVSSTFEVR